MTFIIKFIGICTHLIPKNKLGIPIELKAANKKIPIAHRVVIPNSNLIKDHIDPTRCVPPHIPKLIIPNEAIGDDGLDLAMVARGDGKYELVLDGLEIGFNGVEADNPINPPDHWQALIDLPHVMQKSRGRNPQLHNSVQLEWDDHASAYIDFTSGVTFEVEGPKNDLVVIATLRTGREPSIVFRPRNGEQRSEYRLKTSDKPDDPPPVIVVSNVPVADCGDSDYLLHYLITTMSVRREAPTWKDDNADDADAGPGPGPELYCSSSTFP